MKFLRAVLCLLVSAAPLCLGDIITSGVSESWREVLESLLLYCGLVGIVWLLVFLPLLFFTRRFETWGCWKGGLLGSVLVWALFLVLWWLMKPQGSAAETATWFVDCLILGLCTGLLFALGSLISTERWAHKLGLVLLWILAIGCVFIAFVPHPKEGTLKRDTLNQSQKVRRKGSELLREGKVREGLEALSSVPWDSPDILTARRIMSDVCARIKFTPADPGPEGKVPIFVGEVVRTLPHRPNAANEGLAYHGGFLYESANVGQLRLIHKINAETGDIAQEIHVPEPDLCEGLAVLSNKLYLTLCKCRTGLVYDLGTAQITNRFKIDSYANGLAQDGENLLISDGTGPIRFLDPLTFKEKRRISVFNDSVPVLNMFHMTMVEGQILAAVFMTDRVVKIDPQTGQITGWIDLEGLGPAHFAYRFETVSSLAYDAERKRLFVTGRKWPSIFEIRLRQIN